MRILACFLSGLSMNCQRLTSHIFPDVSYERQQALVQEQLAKLNLRERETVYVEKWRTQDDNEKSKVLVSTLSGSLDLHCTLISNSVLIQIKHDSLNSLNK